MRKFVKKGCMIAAMVTLVVVLYGCGNNDGRDEDPDAGNQTTTQEQTSENAEGTSVNNTGQTNRADGDGVMEDMVDDVGDAIDDFVGESFDTYEKAKAYLLEELREEYPRANFEVRDEAKDLISYDSNNPDAEGYHFEVYETDGNEKIGTYYVDKNRGEIYRYMGKDSMEDL